MQKVVQFGCFTAVGMIHPRAGKKGRKQLLPAESEVER